MSAEPITGTLAVQAMASTIKYLDEKVIVLQRNLDGAYAANDVLFRERARALREVEELRAELREARR